jgi:hypothetical protein
MDQKDKKSQSPSPARKNHPSIFGSIIFTVLNLILLSLLSWVLLVGWFSIQSMLTNTGNVAGEIKNILNNLIAIISHYYPYVVRNLLPDFQSIKALGVHYLGESVATILVGSVEIIVIRFSLFIAFVPLIGLVQFVLVIDGLVQRDKRKFQGARESTFLFHRLRPLVGFSISILFFIYMAIPRACIPDVFLVPMAMLSGLLAMFAIKSFKKYL